MKLHRQLGVLGASFVYSIVLCFILINPAAALCAAPGEGGKWWNSDPARDPISLEIRLINCGDMVLNGQETETTYGLKAYVKQSSGALYQRPEVRARYVKNGGKPWMYAEVPTGGYIDKIWLRIDLNKKSKQKELFVHIESESLDSKPGAISEFWFTKQRPSPKPAKELAVKELPVKDKRHLLRQ